MPRFAANVSMLFDDVPFLDRFARAAQAGFEAVECQFPYRVIKAALKGGYINSIVVDATIAKELTDCFARWEELESKSATKT